MNLGPAQRVRLCLPAGHRQSYTIPLDACAMKDARGSLVLRWTAVVLGERTIELEIWAQLSRSCEKCEDKSGCMPNFVKLERAACGGTFVGNFAPCSDRRLTAVLNKDLKDAAVPTVEAVVFRFSNAFSWFLAKDVELVSLVEWLPYPNNSQELAGEAEELTEMDVEDMQYAYTEHAELDEEQEQDDALQDEEPEELPENEGQLDLEEHAFEDDQLPQDDDQLDLEKHTWEDEHLPQNDEQPPPNDEDDESARRARALAKARRYGCAV